MANVICIIHDDRVRNQTEQYLQQLGMDDLRFATFKNQQEFAALYFRDKPDPEPEAKNDLLTTEEPVEIKLFGEVHLLIFALDSIGGKSGPWIEKLRTNLKRYKHWPANAQLRLIMLKYEDDGISKLDVLHPLLDDLVYLPLDRLVFLQKLEILLNLPKHHKPKFLFNQTVKQEIEISKITRLDRLSDVGLAIRNPIPLKRGLSGHFYVQLPGEKTRLEIRGKVFRSEPHPEFPGQYLVYFTYFGLPKSDLSMIRRALSKANRYQSLYNDDRSVFRFRPDDLFLNVTNNKSFSMVIVDPDISIASNLSSQISKDMDRVKIATENSYQLFLHKYFEHSSGSLGAPKPTEEADFYQSPLTLTITASNFLCLGVDPRPSEGNLILGHSTKDIFATPEKWLTLITDKGSRLVLEEAVGLASKGKTLEKTIIFQDKDDVRRAVNIKIQKGTADHLVTAQISPANLSDIAIKIGVNEHDKELDAIIIDMAFVPEDAQAWIDGLRTRALQVGLIKEPTALKFFIIGDIESLTSARWLDIPDILGFFIKPVDTRQLGFLLSEYLPNKNTVYQYENLGWAQPNLPIHVSKSIQLEALSEFGATLKTRHVMAPGTMLYLRKSIYDNAPNQCLAARVYACEEHSSEEDYFQVYAAYFGINDQFLKFARTWIRENYASQKGKSY